MISHLESDTVVLNKFYSPIYLSFFIFLSGYVHNQPQSFGQHIGKKFRGLFVPWFVFSNLNIALSAVLSLKENRNPGREALWNLLQIRGQYDGIWFVAAIFVAFIPFYFVLKLNKRNALILSTVMLIAAEIYAVMMPKDIFPWESNALPWHLEYIPYAMFLMVLGYYFRSDLEERFDRNNIGSVRAASVAIYLLLIFSLPRFQNTGIIHVIFEYIKTFAGIIMLLLNCKVIKTNRYISYVGANTIVYFALHGKLYAVIEHVLSAKFSSAYAACLANVWLSSMLAVMIAIVMSIILLVPTYIINRFFPWLIGRKNGNPEADKNL